MIVDQRFGDFPVGMRVLAVDDNPICLGILASLLRNCQYHVTTANEAMTALSLLRDSKNQFDLVISDVHMPDMDGFKLLELVGLEMDLPVIMLSANGDTKLVMKGITHGACDYLLKPVRIEELKNIWQHVIRRKKSDSKDHMVNNRNHHEFNDLNRLNRKRKDQEGDEEDENSNNEDVSNQKKPRVVWTVELHRKFVSAVNHMGIDKAVPKKILDLMNVEKLTRENVASHLQKYRLYLKRISCVASHQANMVAALGGIDSAFLRMSSFRGGFQNPQFRSPAIHGGLVQFGHELNMNNLNHVQMGDLITPNSSTTLPIGQSLAIQKGTIDIPTSENRQSNEFSACYENWQGQIEPNGYSFNMVNELGDTMSAMAMQGWDENGIMDGSRQSNLSCNNSIDLGMIQGRPMMGPFVQITETALRTPTSDSIKQQRNLQNRFSYVDNNVGCLEDVINPMMRNQEKGV